ncbi:ATP-binding protein [Pontiellaceae bacterium B12227]|nr:ATP-binding protein [Pontiellaceae bacterium B12227]
MVLSLAAPAEVVDPCFPEQAAGLNTAEGPMMSRWLPVRILQLEDERAELLETIASLPQHNPKPLPDHMGYHSVPRDEAAAGEQQDTFIHVEFSFDPQLAAIALAPALVSEREGSYAFPKRFKIDVLDRGTGWVGGLAEEGGRWVIPPPPYEWVEVVNWMDEDFPDPGPYPVYFNLGDIGVHQLRLTISQAENDFYHALGDMYLFRQKDNSDLTGDNMMVWGKNIEITASDSLTKPPLWDLTYLYDGFVGLGIPLSEEISDAEDFMVSWKHSDSKQTPVQIVLDLGRIRRVGRVQLWPAEAPHGMAIPQFGFPGKVTMELSTNPEFSDAEMFMEDGIRERLHNENLLNIVTGAHRIRYVRLTLEDLANYKGETVLGIGEIRVAEFDEVWSINAAVTAEGMPRAGMEQLPRLVDGFSRKRRILREAEWIRGLALRRPLDRRLVIVEQELELAREAWSGFKLRASIWGGGLIGFGLLGAMVLQRLQRRKILKSLKTRITRDLHDEVGSNLGSITLAARRMEKTGATEEDLTDLSLMTREASASLRDVVWVVDQAIIRLPVLLQKLAERAERVLCDVELHIELVADCPDRIVPLTFKRHVIMFFKEAMHNCARHSRATQVWLTLSADADQLEISIKDNGCGFDAASLNDGWGVDSMRKRASELGGEMYLESGLGKGTRIVLTVPLSSLRNKTDHQYKTSN